MVKELNAIFLEFRERNDIIGVSVTGAGESFCAGADLSYLQSLGSKSFEENLNDSNNLKEMYWNIYSFPKPTIGLINGPAVAGGCGLVTALDIAIASKNAIFGYPEVKIGFVASIVSVFLIRSIGLAQAKQLLYTGELIDSFQAEKIGLVNTIVDKENLDRAAEDFFSQIRKNSPQALTQTKSLLIGFQEDMIKSELEYACRMNAESRQKEDFKEGLKSFLEKRKPIWSKT
jgi:methylglutaconyl-CoA hydratase